jgi:ribosomal-protein-alanine N-acetyltransferase
MNTTKGPVEINTERLLLVRPGTGDAASIFTRYASDSEVTRFLGWPRHRTIADTEAFLVFSEAEWQRWPAGPYLIRSREHGELLGSTGFSFEAPAHAATGYVLAREAWGQGYATEALRAIVDIARHVGVARLNAICHPQHRASSRVLEKCGFTRDEGWPGRVEFPNLVSGVEQEAYRYELWLGTH